MKIRCQRQALLKALQTVSSVTAQKDLYPILENVRISATSGQLYFRTTDLKISLTYLFPMNYGEIIEEGELLIPALRLQNLVKETPDDEILLERQELNGLLSSRDARFDILGEDPEKFPEIPEFIDDSSIQIAGEELQKLIKNTLFATTTEKTRYELDNVLVNIHGDTVRFVATDGKRLALCSKKCEVLSDGLECEFTVPSRGLQQIERVLSATTPKNVKLHYLEKQQNQLLFRTDEVVLSTRLSDAKFPPYERVVPKNLPFKADVSLKEFASGLRRVCLLADEKHKIVEMSFQENSLTLFAMGDGTGEATVKIPIAYEGDSFDIKFNPVFLLDFLKIVESDQFQMWLQSGQSAAFIKDGTGFEYVVLPIKIEDKAE